MSDLEDVSLGIQWPQDRPFQLVGLGLNAVDWICVLPHYPEHNSKVQIDNMYKRGGGQVATACALCAHDKPTPTHSSQNKWQFSLL